MFTEKDILARLQKGESAQAIADEMANILNAANKTYVEEKEKEKEKAKLEAEAKRQKEHRKKEADTIMEAICKWAVKYAEPDKQKDVRAYFAKLDGDTLIEIVDTVEKFNTMFADLESIFDFKPVEKKKNSDQTIADFLAKHGW